MRTKKLLSFLIIGVTTLSLIGCSDTTEVKSETTPETSTNSDTSSLQTEASGTGTKTKPEQKTVDYKIVLETESNNGHGKVIGVETSAKTKEEYVNITHKLLKNTDYSGTSYDAVWIHFYKPGTKEYTNETKHCQAGLALTQNGVAQTLLQNIGDYYLDKKCYDPNAELFDNITNF